MGERSGDPDLNGYERGAALVRAAGLAADAAVTAADLRALEPKTLLEAARSSGWHNRSRVTIDGFMVPKPPLEVFAEGEHNQVPLLVGSMANEGHLLFPINDALTPSSLDKWLRKRFGPQADELRKLYADELEQSAGLAQREILIDQFMAWGCLLYTSPSPRDQRGSRMPSSA